MVLDKGQDNILGVVSKIVLIISSNSFHTSRSVRRIAFFLFLIRYYGILKMIKDKNKGVNIMKTKIIKRTYKFRIYPTLE